MTRYYVFKDGELFCSTATEKDALDEIRAQQAKETHYMLRAEFSYIVGEQVFVGYEQPKKRRAGKDTRNKYLVREISDELVRECGGDVSAAMWAAKTVTIQGLEEVFDYCGGKLHKGRAGYAGYNRERGIEYVAVRI